MRQVAIFVTVGTAAAFTHLAVVAALVELLRLPPLVANVIGFFVAFLVSFAGHARWTFPIARQSYSAARNRFFVVASTGFILNQLAYALALQAVGVRYYLPALATVLLGVAVATFLLSKLWAFAQPEA
jgi:putative flippase GtrA